MIKDITIGQYYPTGSPVHRLDPRFKMLALIAYIVFVFLCNSVASMIFLVAVTTAVLFVTGVPIVSYLKNLKSIWPIILLTAALNVFYINDGKLLLKWGVLQITYLGVRKAVFMALRIMLLIIASAVLTYTTTPNSLTDGLESLMSPLKFIGLGTAVHTVAMMMTIALRFIPTLVDETDRLMNAQRARGADFESGGIFKRVRALIPILIPLLVSSVRRALELSEAMESRCYAPSANRTRLKQLKFSSRDVAALAITAISLSAVILLNKVPIVGLFI